MNLRVDTPSQWAAQFTPAEGYIFDEVRAAQVLDWWQTNLFYTSGRWKDQPFIPTQWQAYILSRLFGVVHEETKLRQFRKVFLGIPKKNGKTEFAAGLALLALYYDEEPSAEVYALASTVIQASIVYSRSSAMVEANPELHSLVQVRPSVKELRAHSGLMKVLSAATVGKQGFSPSCVIGDELHEHKSDEPWLALTSDDAIIARTQPIVIGITTAGQKKAGCVLG